MLQRACLLCQATDDHPKHILAAGDQEPAHHHDCGALSGCAVCAVQVADAPKRANPHGTGKVPVIGDDMRAHLLSLPKRAWQHDESGGVTYEDDPQETTGGEG